MRRSRARTLSARSRASAPAPAGEGLSVGPGGAPLGVTDAELGLIHAAGGLTLATQAGQNITVDGTVNSHTGFSSLTLQSGNNVTLNGNLSVTTLVLNAPAGTVTQRSGSSTPTHLTRTATAAVRLPP